jgi:hypothetical protein
VLIEYVQLYDNSNTNSVKSWEKKMTTEDSISAPEPIQVRDPQIVKMERKVRSAKVMLWIFAIFIALNTAAALFIGQSYKAAEFETGRMSIESALSSYRSNDASSTTVYQQMVTNGWVARDLLETIGEQNATLIEQNSESNGVMTWLFFNTLFTLGVLSVAVIRIGILQVEVRQSKNT